MTCKDCVHYKVCKKYNNVYERELSERYCAECPHFKNKANFVELPCKVGDGIWVVEEDDITCYMFLAKSKGCVIATSWINDYDLDETIEYHIAETQDNLDTDLVVFPEEYCFATKEEAEQKLKGGADNGKVY
jgi:hypothetical protein